MQIVHIVWSLLNGGIETLVVNIANEQSKLYDVKIFVINDMVDLDLIKKIDKKVDLLILSRKLGSKNPLPFLKLNLKLLLMPHSVVNLHSLNMKRAVFAKNFIGIVHSPVHKLLENAKKYLPKMKFLIAVSKYVQTELSQLGYNSILIENGIPISSFRHIEKNYSQTYKIKQIKIVQVGRIHHHHHKGHDVLVYAAKKLTEQGVNNFSIDFIGDGEALPKLKEIVAMQGLEKHINFLGNKSQDYIFEHLCEYDLSIQSSLFEAFGLTLAESMAAKIPVIASDILAFCEILDNGKCGYLVQADNHNALAEKIIEVMNNGYSEQMINDAYDRVKEFYSVEKTAKKYLEVYEQIV